MSQGYYLQGVCLGRTMQEEENVTGELSVADIPIESIGNSFCKSYRGISYRFYSFVPININSAPRSLFYLTNEPLNEPHLRYHFCNIQFMLKNQTTKCKYKEKVKRHSIIFEYFDIKKYSNIKEQALCNFGSQPF